MQKFLIVVVFIVASLLLFIGVLSFIAETNLQKPFDLIMPPALMFAGALLYILLSIGETLNEKLK